MIKLIESPTGSGKTAWAACIGSDGQTPADFGLPHADWRPGQYEALQWIRRDVSGSVIALCRTKNLQDENYAAYGFDVLKGKGNIEYPCIHPQAVSGALAADCKYAGNMYQCKQADQCAYLLQKAHCKQSRKVSMNYYGYLALKDHWPAPSVIFLDEAQQVPGIVLDRAGTTINFKTWQEWNVRAASWGLPYIKPFPALKPGDSGGMITRQAGAIDQAREWLISARNAMREYWRRLNKIAVSKDDLKLKRDCEYIGRKWSSTIEAIESCPGDWWIKSGPRAQAWKGSYRPAFICKPLTARHHAPDYFNLNGHANRVLMSATIGDFATFADRLGIASYQTRIVENVWPLESRPIVDLDCPPMGAASLRKNPRYQSMQADAIANMLKSEHSNDLGLIHVTSKAKAYSLAKLLGARGLSNRVWVTPEKGTEHQAAAWRRASGRNKQLIAIAWSWWEGVDLGEVGVNIIGSIPWAYLGDEYEKAKMRFDTGAFHQDAAFGVEQAAGRNRRGEPEHYKHNGYRGNAVYLADGNWRRLEKYYSKSFIESVTA